MEQSYQKYLLELKKSIEIALEELEEAIIKYPPTQDNETFSFMVKKAISYRDTLRKINDELLNIL